MVFRAILLFNLWKFTNLDRHRSCRTLCSVRTFPRFYCNRRHWQSPHNRTCWNPHNLEHKMMFKDAIQL